MEWLVPRLAAGGFSPAPQTFEKARVPLLPFQLFTWNSCQKRLLKFPLNPDWSLLVPTLIWRSLLRSVCSLPQGTCHLLHLPGWNLCDTAAPAVAGSKCCLSLLSYWIIGGAQTQMHSASLVPWEGEEKGSATPRK